MSEVSPMAAGFPRTEVGGISLSRLIIGTNWILGYSHTSTAADHFIKQKNNSVEVVSKILEAFLNAGVDTIMGLFTGNRLLTDSIKAAEDKTGKGMIIIDTPIINVDNHAAARKEAESVIASSRQSGATFCMPHHSSAEQLVNKNTKTLDRLPDYLQMIREHGMIPGLSALSL